MLVRRNWGPKSAIWGTQLFCLAFGPGRVVEEHSETERGLSERSEFRSSRMFFHGGGNPEGRARARMVFGPFAETKGPRRAGAKPRY